MNIHEYQGKALLKANGVPVLEGVHCTSVEQALMAYDKLGADAVYKLTSIAPFLMACFVWYLPKSQYTYSNMCESLRKNVMEQKQLAFILLFISSSIIYRPITFPFKSTIGIW